MSDAITKKQPTSNFIIEGVVVEESDIISKPENKDFRNFWVLNGNIIEVDWGKARSDFRSTASLSRADFLNAAADQKLITDDEAITAALGNWPASFNAILPNDPSEQRAVKVLWASTTDISRDADLLAAIVASPIPVTDEQLDAMFGYTGQ